jgi:DNA-binding winged helix-turn-helix (wHTH) protein
MQAALRGVLPTATDGEDVQPVPSANDVDATVPARAVRRIADPPQARVFAFAGFRVDPTEERVWRGDEELKVRRKPFAILRHLVERPNHLVTHGEIVDAVWGRVAMSESLLRTHLRELRRVLGKGIIETVSGRGYRFVASVREVVPEPPAQIQTGAETLEVEPSVQLVGRQPELQVLRDALEQVRGGRRRVVLIEGEPGVGKTSLVDAFLQSAQAAGAATVARGACIEQYGGGEAYLPFLSALNGLCREHAGAHFAEVLHRHGSSPLVEMSNAEGATSAEELQRRLAFTQGRMLLELAQSVEALAAEQPLVVALEDLQWADHSTVELLAMLARRREHAQLLIVGTYRSGEVARDHPLHKVASELVVHKQAASVLLHRFSLAELGDYTGLRFGGHAFPDDLLRTLHGSTGGNPLFVATLFDDLEQREMIRRVGGEWRLTATVDEVAARRPESIRRLLDLQIDRFTQEEQRILEAASLAGVTFVTGVVAWALEMDTAEVHATCESLARDGQILRFLGTEAWPDGTMQPRFAFVHVLYRHAARDRIRPGVDRVWHRRIAERIEAGFGDETEDVVAQIPARFASELAARFDVGGALAKSARYYLLAGERALRNEPPGQEPPLATFPPSVSSSFASTSETSA